MTRESGAPHFPGRSPLRSESVFGSACKPEAVPEGGTTVGGSRSEGLYAGLNALCSPPGDRVGSLPVWLDPRDLAKLVGAVRSLRRDQRTKAKWHQEHRQGEGSTVELVRDLAHTEALYARLRALEGPRS